MKQFFQQITLLVLLLAHADLFAEEQLSLSQCLNIAFTKSRLLQVADLSINLAEQKTLEATSQRLPLININGMYTRIGKVTSFSIPAGAGGTMQTFQFGTPNRVNLDVKMQWSLYTWGRISNTIALSRAGADISNMQKKQQLASVTDQVLRAFYAILLNQEIIRLHEFNLRRAENHLQVAEKRFQSGTVPKLELLRAQVQQQNAESTLEDACDNLIKSKIFLGKIIGRPDHDFTVAGAFVYQPVDLNEQELLTRAQQIRTDFQVLKLQQQINQKQIRAAASNNKPQLFLFSGYNVQNGFDPMEPERFIDNWNIGVQVALPLFDGFATSSKVQQAQLQLQMTHLQQEELEDIIRMQVQQALVTIRQSKNNISNQEQNITLAQEALKIAETQYQGGLISSLEVLDAQQRLSQSELLQTQAIFNHIMATLDLCRAIENYSLFEKTLE